ncbi:MAG: TadE/TadG family type IV pilus assembly protein [Hyphomicrobium sp.]
MFRNRPTGFLMSIRRFVANTAGVAMIEFAALVPLMALMALGTFEVGRSVIVHKRFQRAVAMVGDLIAREQFLDNQNSTAKTPEQETLDNLDGIMDAAEQVMWPYDTAPLKIGVMQIFAPAANPNNTSIVWRYQHHSMSIPTCGSNKSMPATGMIVGNSYAILVEAEYKYTSVLKNFMPYDFSNKPFKDTVANSPRNNCVQYASRACNAACPTP